MRWLYKNGDFRKDPVNAVYFLEAALHYWETMEQTQKYPNMTAWGMDRALRLADSGPIINLATNSVNYLDEDESFVLCREHGGGIEFGMHGHQGANGTRGTPVNSNPTTATNPNAIMSRTKGYGLSVIATSDLIVSDLLSSMRRPGA